MANEQTHHEMEISMRWCLYVYKESLLPQIWEVDLIVQDTIIANYASKLPLLSPFDLCEPKTSCSFHGLPITGLASQLALHIQLHVNKLHCDFCQLNMAIRLGKCRKNRLAK